MQFRDYIPTMAETDAALEAELSGMTISSFNASPANGDELELIAALRVAAAADIEAMNVSTADISTFHSQCIMATCRPMPQVVG